jgi:SAM-dependent methyltransferase
MRASRILQRFRPDPKLDAELRWWLNEFDAVVRGGGLYPGDVADYIDDDCPAGEYHDRRMQIARAEVRRVLVEAGIEDEAFFEGKVVVDIGPGALGFPDACPARVSFGVDPLAERFAEAGLALDSPAIYLSVGAEAIPLVSGSVDIVLSRNSLDHVDDPPAVVAEARRLLRPGGTLILNFDVGHGPTATEPHALTEPQVLGWLAGMEIVRHASGARSHGGDGHAVVITARERGT